MTDDRELLELAARAAGIETQWIGSVLCDRHGLALHWNPLTDPGDALRLAGSLDISVMQPAPEDNGNVLALWPHGGGVSEPRLSDRLAATMRAIVRAAAEIGRAKP